MKYAFCIFLHLSSLCRLCTLVSVSLTQVHLSPVHLSLRAFEYLNPLDRSLKSTSDTVENWMNSTRRDLRWCEVKGDEIIWTWKHMKSISYYYHSIISLYILYIVFALSLLFEVGCCPGFTVPIQIPKVPQPEWITSSCVRTCKLMTKIIAWHLQALWGSWSQGWEMMGLEGRNDESNWFERDPHESRHCPNDDRSPHQKAKARVKKAHFFLPSIQFWRPQCSCLSCCRAETLSLWSLRTSLAAYHVLSIYIIISVLIICLHFSLLQSYHVIHSIAVFTITVWLEPKLG